MWKGVLNIESETDKDRVLSPHHPDVLTILTRSDPRRAETRLFPMAAPTQLSYEICTI